MPLRCAPILRKASHSPFQNTRTCRKAQGAETVEQANSVYVAGRTPAASTLTDDAVLTPRELEGLALVAAGWSDREIADRLFNSRHTATTHVGNILLKLDVATRAAAAARAVQAGYIDGQGNLPVR